MDSKIWKLSKTDSLALKTYYDNHLDNYKKPKGVVAIIAKSSNLKAVKKVAKLLKSNMELDHVKALVKNPSTPDVTFKSGSFALNSKDLPGGFQVQTGISKVYKQDGDFMIVKVDKITPEFQKPFEEVRGAVQSDYEAEKEKQWLGSLEKKYQVIINKDVLQNVKTQLQKQ